MIGNGSISNEDTTMYFYKFCSTTDPWLTEKSNWFAYIVSIIIKSKQWKSMYLVVELATGELIKFSDTCPGDTCLQDEDVENFVYIADYIVI